MKEKLNLESENRIAFLDILRFLAAFIVLFGHLYDDNALEHPGFLMFDLKKNYALLYHGYAGVIIFFLISGYIIPSAIARCDNIKDFLIKRFIRIYPLFILVALYTMIRYDTFAIEMLPGFILPIAEFINGKFLIKSADWTLRVEFLFYILFGLIYFKKIFNFKTIFISLIAVYFFYIFNFGFFPKRSFVSIIYLNFIFCGSLLYLIEKENFKNYNNIFWIFLFIIFNSYFIALFLLDIGCLNGILFGSVLFLLFYFLHQTRWQIKSNNFIKFLGDISFPCYLLHLIIYRDLYNLTKSHLITPIIFIGICYFVYIFIEKPAMNILKKTYYSFKKHNLLR